MICGDGRRHPTSYLLGVGDGLFPAESRSLQIHSVVWYPENKIKKIDSIASQINLGIDGDATINVIQNK
jgi:hypothetical protein